MRSGSEVFHNNRRSRLGSRHVDIHSSHTQQQGQRQQQQHQHSNSNSNSNSRRIYNERRRGGFHRTSQFNACHHFPTRLYTSHQHHLNPYTSLLSERDTVQVDEGSSQPSIGNTSINLDNFRVVGNREGRTIGNDRLPGAVLLARERLLERLRGVSLSSNRSSNRASLRSTRNGLTVGYDYDLVDAMGDHWETETSRESLTRDHLLTDSILQTGQLSGTQPTTSKRRPTGLTQYALTCLQLEIFTESHSCDDDEGKIARASQECSICLESFSEGDKLTCLPCAHRFHFACLDPWIRACGDCPYCRREIVVSVN